MLLWSKVSGNATVNYQVYINRIIYRSLPNAFTISQLKSNTIFDVRVRANNSAGFGSYSNMQTFTTSKLL